MKFTRVFVKRFPKSEVLRQFIRGSVTATVVVEAHPDRIAEIIRRATKPARPSGAPLEALIE